MSTGRLTWGPRYTKAGYAVQAVGVFGIVSAFTLWTGMWTVISLVGGAALVLAGLWWVTGLYRVVWWPWRGAPTVYGPADPEDVSWVRAAVFASTWALVGYLLPLRMALSNRVAWGTWVTVAAATLTYRRDRGEYYQREGNGAKVSVALVEARWLYDRPLPHGKNLAECHAAIMERLGR